MAGPPPIGRRAGRRLSRFAKDKKSAGILDGYIRESLTLLRQHWATL
jgi:hypothetical protein